MVGVLSPPPLCRHVAYVLERRDCRLAFPSKGMHRGMAVLCVRARSRMHRAITVSLFRVITHASWNDHLPFCR